MTRVEAARVVAVLLAAFPHARNTDQTSVVYEESLLDLEYAAVDRAVRALILTERDFIPSIAKIRDAVLSVTGNGRRAGGDAWGDVRKAVGRWGIDREAEALRSFADPITAQVIGRLGWRELCNSDETDPSYRARFIQLYDHLAADAHRSVQSGGLLPASPARHALGRPADDSTRSIGQVLNKLLPGGKK